MLLYPQVTWLPVADGEGLVGYVETPWILASLGEPVCAKDAYGEAMESFVAHARARGKDAVFLMVGEEMAAEGRKREAAIVPLGPEHYFDVARYEPRGHRGHQIRSAVRQLEGRGAEVHSYDCRVRDAALEAEMAAVASRWLRRPPAPFRPHVLGFRHAGRGGPLFEDRELKLCYYATVDGKVAAFAVAAPIWARSGVFLEHFIHDPDAPKASSDLLLLGALGLLRGNGTALATLGPSPDPDLRGAEGVSPAALLLCGPFLWMARRLMGLPSLARYRNKWRTGLSEDRYLVKLPRRLRLRDLAGILRVSGVPR